VVFPGLPVNADTWAPVRDALGSARVVDLPGLGASGGRRADWLTWSTALIGETGARHLVGHSIGAAAALEAAAARPDLVDQLTLVSPFFLQARSGFTSRWTPLTRSYLRRVRPETLSRRLTGGAEHAQALASSAADLRRGGVASRVARLLADAGGERWRSELRTAVGQYPGPVHVIVGADDPLTPGARTLLDTLPQAAVTVISGAGHHPQLTHASELAHAIGEFTARTPATEVGVQQI